MPPLLAEGLPLRTSASNHWSSPSQKISMALPVICLAWVLFRISGTDASFAVWDSVLLLVLRSEIRVGAGAAAAAAARLDAAAPPLTLTLAGFG